MQLATAITPTPCLRRSGPFSTQAFGAAPPAPKPAGRHSTLVVAGGHKITIAQRVSSMGMGRRSSAPVAASAGFSFAAGAA
ncbi:MAG: hypothetical protein KG075_07375 [Alphaproteobacteria bacterium]|nr:hypothetical protein [Alphaproteobacteria bacterium]